MPKDLDAGVRVRAVGVGWVETGSRRGWLLWKDKLGRLRWFKSGRVNLYVRKPAKPYFCAKTINVIFADGNIGKASFSGDVGLSKEKKEFVFTVYLRKEGRIMIPKEVRDALDIEDGALVECKVKKVK